jgi:hypothetical protein
MGGGYMSDQIVSSLGIEESTSSWWALLFCHILTISTIHNNVSEGLYY